MRQVRPKSIEAKVLTASGLAAFVAGLSFASCASQPAVDVSVEDPDGYRSSAAWAQLVVYPDTCPDRSVLEKGEVTPNVKLFTVAADQDFPEVGTLDKAKFGFAVILRDSNCGVIAFGCTPVDLDHHRHITIRLNEHDDVDHTAAACNASAGQACVDGACTDAAPQEGGADVPNDHSAEGGLGCTFKLVAAANLDNPAASGAAFAGPVVVPTPKGFVVVYREIDAGGSSARAIRQFVGDDGAKGARANAPVKPCPGNQASNGVTATWSSTQNAGFMAVSSVACAPDPPEAYIANFDQGGQTITEVTYPLPGPIRLTGPAGAAAYPASTQFLLAAVSDTAPVLYTFDGVSVNSNIGAIQNGGGVATFAQVAATGGIVATLADSDASGGRTALSVQPPGSGAISTSFLSAGSFAALTVWGDRALAAVPNGNGVEWAVVNATGDPVADGSLSGGPFDSIDAAVLNDRVVVAAGATAKITLFRMDENNGTMSAGASFQATLVSPLGNATLTNYDGGRVSVAAARNRVVVAWLNSAAPIPNATTAPGGFAVLACED